MEETNERITELEAKVKELEDRLKQLGKQITGIKTGQEDLKLDIDILKEGGNI
jgi:TolA-binding protein